MEKREFLNAIMACRRRLNMAGFLKKLVFALSVGAGVGVLFQAAAFVTPLYYVNVYTGLAMLFAVLAALVTSCIRRITMEQAALVMDSFGFQERIITAYEHLKAEGKLLALQREDALAWLKRHRDKIRIPLWPDWRRTALSTLLIALMIGLALVPSPMKDRAKELHRIRQEAREKEKEIEEVLEELAKLEEAEQEELTPEQLAALQEMMESLQSSLAEYQQASSAESLQAAGEKLNYKYENMSSQMSSIAQSIQNGASVSPMTAQSMQAMADKLQEMSGNSSSGGQELASNQGQTGDGQNGGQNGNGQSGVGQNGQNGNGQNENGQNNQSGDGQGDGQGNGQGDGQGDGQGSGSGNGQGDGQGDGQGSGSGNSQGDGDGQGNGSGSGDGSGEGRGTGSSNSLHDYVSVPNAIADSGNLTGNAGNHNDSEYFRAQNGLSWEGTHVSHEAVIGSYEQNAYEGIAAGRYPSGMENVIKEYFASFN